MISCQEFTEESESASAGGNAQEIGDRLRRVEVLPVRCYRSYDTAGFCWGRLKSLAFIASTALCLARVDAHQWPLHVNDGTDDGGIVFGFLVHHRLSNRGMIKQVLEGTAYLNGADTNSTGFKIAAVLMHLLVIEAESASGSSYDIYYTPGAKQMR
ncbi:hypothetical protein DL769_000205 [Monosporascus sp. CRB-8-3]|nr:hypothetical protein DL769_000205 [Monosporascus sp. CRB-8-3]